MPEAINRHCPRCGRKAHDRLLVQCPDCRVPFVPEEPSSAPAEVMPDAVRLLAAQVFGSWKFWAALIVIVAGAAWAIVSVADRMIDARAKAYLNTLSQQATNHIGSVSSQISNQIVQEFRQPRIKAAIEQAARDKAAEIITNGVRPSLNAFEDALDVATSRLAHSSNTIAQLERNAQEAQRRIPPPETFAQRQAPQAPAPTNPPTSVAATGTAAAPKPASAPAAGNPSDTGPVKLSLSNQSIQPSGTGFLVTLNFALNNNNSGTVDMMAGTYRQTAKIVNISPVGAAPIGPPQFTPGGDAAKIQFNVTAGQPPTVVLELSAPTIIRIESDSFDNDLTIPVAADRMQIPPPTK